jgi:hypothetical protein
MVLGYIGEILIKLGKDNNRDIPPINCLVINKDTGLPGRGIEWFISEDDFSKLTRSQKQEVVNKQLVRIFIFKDWNWVLDQLNLKPIIPLGEKQLLTRAKEYQRGGESPYHKAFKEYIAHIGKYLSRLRKLDHAIVLKVGFEP